MRHLGLGRWRQVASAPPSHLPRPPRHTWRAGARAPPGPGQVATGGFGPSKPPACPPSPHVEGWSTCATWLLGGQVAPGGFAPFQATCPSSPHLPGGLEHVRHLGLGRWRQVASAPPSHLSPLARHTWRVLSTCATCLCFKRQVIRATARTMAAKREPPPAAPLLAWQDKLWDTALKTQHMPPSFKSRAEAARKATGTRRVWAYDVPPAPGGAAGPKRFVAADEDAFRRAYDAVPQNQRHAYEMLDACRPCRPYFDLDGAHNGAEAQAIVGQVVAAASEAILPSCASHRDVTIEPLVLAATHRNGKFSRHVILQVSSAAPTLTGRRAVLLPGAKAAGALASDVARRLAGDLARAAVQVDLGIYHTGRCFRLIGSSKLAGEHGQAAFTLARAESAERFAALRWPSIFYASLVHPRPVDVHQFLLTTVAVGGDGAPLTSGTGSVAGAGKRPLAEACRGFEPGLQTYVNMITDSPLLETPRMVARRHLQHFISGTGPPPHMLRTAVNWAGAHLLRLGCPARGTDGAKSAIAHWSVQQMAYEAILRVYPFAGGHCAHVGRPHKRQRIVLVLDLHSGSLYQQCFDPDCRVSKNGGYMEASKQLGTKPEMRLCVSSLDYLASQRCLNPPVNTRYPRTPSAATSNTTIFTDGYVLEDDVRCHPAEESSGADLPGVAAVKLPGGSATDGTSRPALGEVAANTPPPKKAPKRAELVKAPDDRRGGRLWRYATPFEQVGPVAVATWTKEASTAIGSEVAVKEFRENGATFLAVEDKSLGGGQVMLQYGDGDGPLHPGQELLGMRRGLVLGETEEESWERAVMELLWRFGSGGRAPSCYCLVVRPEGRTRGWCLVDTFESPSNYLKYSNSSQGTGLPPTFIVGEAADAHMLVELQPSYSEVSLHSRLTWNYQPMLPTTPPVPRPQLRLGAAQSASRPGVSLPGECD